MMLEYISEAKAAARLRAALHAVLERGEHLTRDLGGSASTSQFADAIRREMEK
jgi:isocitrate/isopropylmalate dehydrogenase